MARRGPARWRPQPRLSRWGPRRMDSDTRRRVRTLPLGAPAVRGRQAGRTRRARLRPAAGPRREPRPAGAPRRRCSSASGRDSSSTRTTCRRRSRACAACSAPAPSAPCRASATGSNWQSPPTATPAPPAPAAADRRGAAAPAVPRRAWPHRLAPLVGRDADLRRCEDGARARVPGDASSASRASARRDSPQEVLAREAGDRRSRGGVGVARAPLEVGRAGAARRSRSHSGCRCRMAVDGFAALGHALEQRAAAAGPRLCRAPRPNRSPRRSRNCCPRDPGACACWSRARHRSASPARSSTAWRRCPVPDPDVAAGRWRRSTPAVALFAQRAAAADRGFELSRRQHRAGGGHLPPARRQPAGARTRGRARAGARARRAARAARRPLPAAEQPRRGRRCRATARCTPRSSGATACCRPAEQRVFDRLGAFAGSFSLDSAARTASPMPTIDTAEAIDLIGRLVDRSLVTRAAGRSAALRAARDARAYYRARATRRAGRARRGARGAWRQRCCELLDTGVRSEYWSLDEAIWLQRYAPDLDNVRAAIDWATRPRPRPRGRAVWLRLAAVRRDGAVRRGARALRADRARCSTTACRAHASGGSGKRSPPTTRRASATARATRRSSRPRMHAETRDTRSHYYALMQLALNWRVDTAAARAAFAAARALEDPAWPARLLTLRRARPKARC